MEPVLPELWCPGAGLLVSVFPLCVLFRLLIFSQSLRHSSSSACYCSLWASPLSSTPFLNHQLPNGVNLVELLE